MLSNMENRDSSRPLPPAKVRRRTSIRAKEEVTTSTPPPAYASSTFPFPSHNSSSLDFGGDILDIPMDATLRRIAAWDEQSPSSSFEESNPQPEDLEWMNERSHEELEELLFKAHGIIREREHELGVASNVVKKVYDHNVALKSKHEALLARIPVSSPAMSVHSRHVSSSASETNVPDRHSTRARKVSIAMADISLLADQNAELLGKLQKLEEDATSADVVGRRELKRLEKEIAYLREALEKTQARSEELEDKVKDAVTNEAARRKKEREAMRNAKRDSKKETTVVNFAPPGSKFGGPSEAYSLLQVGESPSRNRYAPGLSTAPSSGDLLSDHVLVSQLLNKIKELEETNARIQQQQSETANKLADVQRDATNMAKVYELLSDNDAVQLELELEESSKSEKRLKVEKGNAEVPTIRFRSLRRNMEDSLSTDGSFVFPPGTTHGTKVRKTVMGLFDEQEDKSVSKDEAKPHYLPLAESFDGSSRSSSSVNLTSPSAAEQLSPLHFFSPLVQSDLPSGRTLQNELEGMLGQGTWHLSGTDHMRTASLSNLSGFSVPATPSSVPGSWSRMLPSDADYANTSTVSQSESHSGLPTPNHTPERAPRENSLKLSVSPPTPDIGSEQSSQTTTRADQKTMHPSRLQHMSWTLKSRKNRWVERMLYHSGKSQGHAGDGETRNNPGHSNAVDDTIVNNDVVDSIEYDNGDNGQDESGSQMATPRSSERILDEPQKNMETAVRRRDDDNERVAAKNNNNSYLFQLWLWFQFAIVVLIFVFAMAKKGPGAVLAAKGGGEVEGRGRQRRAAVVK